MIQKLLIGISLTTGDRKEKVLLYKPSCCVWTGGGQPSLEEMDISNKKIWDTLSKIYLMQKN